ncbi:MAG TPA: NADH-quinone oxidoreductase subunit C [Pseudomonadales bacterium]|nr:NADH-quinone oxidoreductase subunit C [Pseudomonadales bacterium]
MSVDALFERCRQSGIALADALDRDSLTPAACMKVAPESWKSVALLAHEMGFRWSAFWAQQISTDVLEALCCLEIEGNYLIVRAVVPHGMQLPSHAGVYAAADRPERHAHDLLGLQFAVAPDERRWTRHLAWGADEFPLRDDFEAHAPGELTPPDDQYPFIAARGAGVVEIPVGPVHAGIIEPGHFRFQALGETVLNLEQHLGYVHKGIEKLAVGRDTAGLARLAGRVSGDTTVAHTWAACQAIERIAETDIPPRGAYLRAVMCERERVANHMGDIGAICNDVAYAFAQVQLTRLKEAFVRENERVFGHRFMMDRIVPGGVTVAPNDEALSQMAFNARALAHEFSQIIDRIEASESLEDRLMTSGRLTPEQAATLGCVGYLGKASGMGFDVRRAVPYPPYDQFKPTVTVYRAGDVAARARVRADEAIHSLLQIAEMIEALPGGEVFVPVSVLHAGEGVGFVEAWRGEIVTYVRLADDGTVLRFFPRDPSWLMWPALELLQQGNIVPDFPVCNKSVNGSYSGHDL